MTNACTIKSTAHTSQPKAIWGTGLLNSQALSIFRILFATLLLFDLFAYVLPHWEFLYSAKGAFMASERTTDMIWSFLRYSDSPYYQYPIIGIYIVALLALLVGFRTRLAAFIAFLILEVTLDRNPAAEAGAENLQSILLLWSCFLPLDRYWSITAALRGQPQSKRPDRWPIIPVLAIKLQIMIVYFYSGLYKAISDVWKGGDAIHYTLSDQFFGGGYYSAYINDLVPHNVFFLMCWAIIIFQLIFSFCIYFPYKNDYFRGAMLLFAASMHIGFIILMQLHLFPFLSLIYLFIMVPDRWINALLKKRRARMANIRIFYDPDCGFCRAVSRIFAEFCLGPTAKIDPADRDPEAHKLLKQHDSWVVYGHDNQTYLKWNAVSYILRQSPLFWIFGAVTNITLLKPVMEKLYHFIGRNRHTLSTVTKPVLVEKSESYPDKTQQIICLFLLCIMVSFTTYRLPQIAKHFKMPPDLRMLGVQTGTSQAWDLFAPDTTAYSYIFDVRAWNETDDKINLTPYFSKHFKKDVKYFDFNSPRLLKYYAAMFPTRNPRHRTGYARYLCHQTTQTVQPAARIKMRLNTQHNYEKDRWSEVNEEFSCADLLHSKK